MLGTAGGTRVASRTWRVGSGGALAGCTTGLPWRALFVAALLTVAAGGVLHQGVFADRTAVVPASERAFSHESLLSLPLAAQGPVSAALGADRAGYRVSGAGGVISASNPAQRLHATFTAAGVSVAAGSARLGLSLQAVGYRSSLKVVGAVTPVAHGNRVTYSHSSVSEWYANGPLGVEQGFTLAHAPTGQDTGPLTLSLALSGNTHAWVVNGGKGIAFVRDGTNLLRYDGLVVTDARGRMLHGWIQLAGSYVLLHVDTRDAQYPVTVDPLVQQGATLTGSDEEHPGPGTYFGQSVAMSADGNTALIGGPVDANGRGAVWAFIRSGATWSQDGPKLTIPSAGAFGRSVALSASGTTALVGDGNKAWVFRRSGSTWIEESVLTPSTPGNEFGKSVAISGDGNTAIVGAPASLGKAFVFARSGGAWTQTAELSGPTNVGFGWTVAISGDGSTALVDAPNTSSRQGTVVVFLRSGSSWAEQAQLVASHINASYELGRALALSENGDTALLGSGQANKALGGVWAFTRTGSTWTEQQELTNAAPDQTGFGEAVAVSASGDIAIIGADGSSVPPDYGAVHVFTRSGSTWAAGEELAASLSPGESSAFGSSVALSADASAAIGGGPLAGFSGRIAEPEFVGGVWAFASGQAPPRAQTEPATAVTETTAILNGTVNPNGANVTECWVEYGLLAGPPYEHRAACTPAPGGAVGVVAVTLSIAGLAPGTLYHYRVVAANSGGISDGADETLETVITPPEFGRCLSVPAGDGSFKSSSCTAAQPHGKYQWSQGVAKTGFGVAGGGSRIENHAELITCLAQTGSGRYSGVNEVQSLTLRFTGCKSNGAGCATLGAAPEEVVVPSLEGRLVWESKSTKKVALDVYPPSGSRRLATINCASSSIDLEGSVLVPLKADKMTATQALKYAASKGKQKPSEYETHSGTKVKAILEINREPTGLSITGDTLTSEEPLEINAVV